MKTSLRQSIPVMVTVIALSAVAACSAGPAGEPTATGSEAPADGVTTLRFWQNEFDAVDNGWYAQRVEDFNAAHDTIQIEHQVIADGAWDQSLKSAQAAGTTPDFYTMPYNVVQPKARAGELAPISEYVSDEAWADVQDAVLDSVTVNGQQYAYPFYLEPGGMLIYRRDLFEQVGLDPAAPPSTWDDLIAAGEALKSTGLVPFQIAETAVELSWTTWGQQVNAAGHLPISDDWSTSLADDPAYAKIFQLYQDLYANGIVAEQSLSSYGDISPLGQGQVAMAANGSWAVSVLLSDYPDLIEDLALAPLPSFDGDQTKPTTTLGGWALGVDAKAADPAAAGQAIAWMLAEDPKGPAEYFESARYTKFSPRDSVVALIAETGDTSVNPWYDVMANDIVPYQILEATYAWDVSLAFGTALERAMRGEAVESAQAGAHAEIQRLIDTLDLAAQRG